MTWDETIAFIRSQPEYKNLVEWAYFDADLPKNVERFRQTQEYAATCQLIRKYAPQAKKIADIGCGNGMSSIAFALEGWDVTSLEPDPSDTVGAGAIRWLKNHYQIQNLQIFEDIAERMPLEAAGFDVVYIRQAMHHAQDLEQFIAQAARILKKGGLLLTIRDHVVYNEPDKQWFLENHPLQKFYGGENAYQAGEYQSAMRKAGLEVRETLAYYDSVINYFPTASAPIEKSRPNQTIIRAWQESIWMKIPYLRRFVFQHYTQKYGQLLDESKISGRMYSFVATKP
jgi:SAM-dependent methyltransferase